MMHASQKWLGLVDETYEVGPRDALAAMEYQGRGSSPSQQVSVIFSLHLLIDLRAKGRKD